MPSGDGLRMAVAKASCAEYGQRGHAVQIKNYTREIEPTASVPSEPGRRMLSASTFTGWGECTSTPSTQSPVAVGPRALVVRPVFRVVRAHANGRKHRLAARGREGVVGLRRALRSGSRPVVWRAGAAEEAPARTRAPATKRWGRARGTYVFQIARHVISNWAIIQKQSKIASRLLH